ncbi:alpha/beta hydrolase [Corynebacterium bovis]|uniref:alpha/beta fold hydrolase n=1 Tax=Corynebacterium bovis TaxID=36808 RepID=UPI002448FE69|nr:alpha/beta hydrolase [Corynebacterium bovis]MDH2456824.1 alpha/beta hydrolase [Corynebacterium bovis]
MLQGKVSMVNGPAVHVTRRGGTRVSLALDRRGAGVPTVQLHGLTSSRRRDVALGMDFTAGIDGLDVIRYDAAGHGQSDGPADPEAYTWPRLAEDLWAVLDATVPDEPVHGVGQSMGTATLITAACAHPERFASLTLVIPPTAWSLRAEQREEYLRSADIVDKYGRDTFAEGTRDEPLPPAVDPARPFTYPDVTEELLPAVFRGAAMTDLPPAETVAEIGRRGGPDGTGVPVQILAWVGDPSHPVEVARMLHGAVGGSTLSVAETADEAARWPDMIRAWILGRD